MKFQQILSDYNHKSSLSNWKNSSILQNQNLIVYICTFMCTFTIEYTCKYTCYILQYQNDTQDRMHALSVLIQPKVAPLHTFIIQFHFVILKKNYTCSNLLGMKNDLHNFACYGNRLSTESSRFLQFVLVIDTFTTK